MTKWCVFLYFYNYSSNITLQDSIIEDLFGLKFSSTGDILCADTSDLELDLPQETPKGKVRELEPGEIRDEKYVSYHYIPFHFDMQDFVYQGLKVS